MKLPFPIPLCVLACTIPLGAIAQQGDGTKFSAAANVFKPAKVEATPERIRSLKVPKGFTIAPFATGLKNVRILAVAPNGDVYASRRDQGDVVLLRDANGDGRADGAPRIVASRAGLHGLAINDNRLYLTTVKEVFVADIQPDGQLGPLDMIIGDLPDAGQHPNRTIAFGPDGMLFITVGSTCNDCNESNPENATILRATPDGKSRTIFASGLRNTIGIDWHPQTGELWGLDHGIDFLGDEQQQEELNKIEQGKMYGWPHVYANGKLYPQSTPQGELTKEQWRARSIPMELGYTAHAAPMQLVFAAASHFPSAYRGDAFATMRGSWNRMQPSGYEIVRIRFADGKPKSIEPFVSGFLTDGGKTHIARPVGLAWAKDGAMLMADDANGVIYRIAYTGNDGSPPSRALPPSRAMIEQTSKGIGVPLANQRPETAASAGLTITADTFKPNGAIPSKHSEYADGVSPALRWTSVPMAKSYAIIMEDPDARPIKPFVHWLAWNIPPNVTSLPEGLQEQPRLTEPEGVLQGRTSRGSIGYYGPRPPVGDPAHRYHFQVYALNALLDVPFGADRDQLLAAMQGKVIAKGELIGTFDQKQQPQK